MPDGFNNFNPGFCTCRWSGRGLLVPWAVMPGLQREAALWTAQMATRTPSFFKRSEAHGGPQAAPVPLLAPAFGPRFQRRRRLCPAALPRTGVAEHAVCPAVLE